MQSNVDHNTIQELVADAQEEDFQKLVVGAVIHKGDKFLLLERVESDFMGGLVELPSGTVEVGEDLITALIREVKEETGLVVTSNKAYLGSFDYTSGSGRKTRQFNFLVKVEHVEIKLSSTEHQAYHFVGVSDAAFTTLNISDATKAVIKTATRHPLMTVDECEDSIAGM